MGRRVPVGHSAYAIVGRAAPIAGTEKWTLGIWPPVLEAGTVRNERHPGSRAATTSNLEGGEQVLLRYHTRAQAWWVDLRQRVSDDRGATAVEYAIMVAFIAAVIVGGVALLGQATNGNFQKVQFPP